jgi:hypothetical protein
MIPRLASDHDGEIVATVRAIGRLLKANGNDWHDLTASICLPAPADWRSEARFCTANAARLTERELDFIVTLARYRGIPSPKQQQWLRDISDRLRGGA